MRLLWGESLSVEVADLWTEPRIKGSPGVRPQQRPSYLQRGTPGPYWSLSEESSPHNFPS